MSIRILYGIKCDTGKHTHLTVRIEIMFVSRFVQIFTLLPPIATGESALEHRNRKQKTKIIFNIIVVKLEHKKKNTSHERNKKLLSRTFISNI